MVPLFCHEDTNLSAEASRVGRDTVSEFLRVLVALYLPFVNMGELNAPILKNLMKNGFFLLDLKLIPRQVFDCGVKITLVH